MVGMCRPPRRHVCVCTKCESHKQWANARSVHLPRMRENSQFFFLLSFRSFSFFHVAHETERGNKKQLWNEHWTIWEMKMPPSAWSRHTATNTILSHKMCVCVRARENTQRRRQNEFFYIFFFFLYEWANAIRHPEPWDVRRRDFVEVKWCKVLSDLLTDFPLESGIKTAPPAFYFSFQLRVADDVLGALHR